MPEAARISDFHVCPKVEPGPVFRFLVEDRTPPQKPVKWTEASRAVIDAARSERALQLIEESVDRYASLYDGEQGRAFDDVAPYLVKLERESGLP